MRKIKFPLLLITVLGLINLVVSNSCKKDPQATVEYLLAHGTWTLASVQVYYFTGSTNTHVDTLNTTCTSTQSFTFNSDFTCNYKNFACITQSTTGGWHFSQDKLTLLSNIRCQDTLAGKTITDIPFDSARVDNLGQFSLVLATGNINPYYTSTTKRRIVRYGFIRQ